MPLQNNNIQRIIFFSATLTLFASLISCDPEEKQRILVGMDNISGDYTELWFGPEEILIVDEFNGFFRVPYFQNRDEIHFVSDMLKFDMLFVQYIDDNRLILKNNDSVFFTCFEAKIPYHINPLEVDFDSDEHGHDLLLFQLEFTSRMNYFFRYLERNSFTTNY